MSHGRIAFVLGEAGMMDIDVSEGEDTVSPCSNTLRIDEHIPKPTWHQWGISTSHGAIFMPHGAIFMSHGRIAFVLGAVRKVNIEVSGMGRHGKSVFGRIYDDL